MFVAALERSAPGNAGGATTGTGYAFTPEKVKVDNSGQGHVNLFGANATVPIVSGGADTEKGVQTYYPAAQPGVYLNKDFIPVRGDLKGGLHGVTYLPNLYSDIALHSANIDANLHTAKTHGCVGVTGTAGMTSQNWNQVVGVLGLLSSTNVAIQ